jgi:septal ring factor EnvC (AmiA/AmiB activator)
VTWESLLPFAAILLTLAGFISNALALRHQGKISQLTFRDIERQLEECRRDGRLKEERISALEATIENLEKQRNDLLIELARAFKRPGRGG